MKMIALASAAALFALSASAEEAAEDTTVVEETTVDTTTGEPRPMGQRGAVLAALAEGGMSMEQWLHKTEQRKARRHARKVARREARA